MVTRIQNKYVFPAYGYAIVDYTSANVNDQLHKFECLQKHTNAFTLTKTDT